MSKIVFSALRYVFYKTGEIKVIDYSNGVIMNSHIKESVFSKITYNLFKSPHIEYYYYRNNKLISEHELVKKSNLIKQYWKYHYYRKYNITKMAPCFNELLYMPSKGSFEGGFYFKDFLKKYQLPHIESSSQIQTATSQIQTATSQIQTLTPQIQSVTSQIQTLTPQIQPQTIIPFIYKLSISSYSNDLTCWYNIGRILHDIYNGSDYGLYLWKQFNLKYSYYCKKTWSKITLHMKSPINYLKNLTYNI